MPMNGLPTVLNTSNVAFMKRFATLLLVLTCGLLAAAAAAEYDDIKARAEQLYAEKSYALALELYEKAAQMEISPEARRWVQFRIADTMWRAQAATETSDNTRLEQAREQLDKLVRDIQRPEEQDRVWAEVHESLGDFHWARRNQQNWGAAWQHYQKALDWWAGSPNIDLARQRYIEIVKTVASPPGRPRHYYYGYYGNILPLQILENYLKIAKTDNEKAHANYLIAMTLRHQGGDWDLRQRIPEAFEAAVQSGQKTEWYDDALFNFAQWMEQQGRVELRDGQWHQEPDYIKALDLYRRLIREFSKGETRYYDQAEQRIRDITKPAVNVNVSHIFLPNSEIQYHLNWRNVGRIDLALYPVDLTRDVRFGDSKVSSSQWLQQVDLVRLEKIKTWSKDTEDKGDHKPGHETLRLEEELQPGAYVIEAVAGGETARELVLITDASVVLKTSGRQALVYFCNALNGSPIGDAPVSLWERYYDGSNWHWRQSEKKTSDEGLALFEIRDAKRNNVDLFAAAIKNDRQAFSTGNSYGRYRDEPTWRIYAFTDRPAYRPDETAHWKFVARRYNGSVYSTPANEAIWYRIDGPDNALVKEGEITLNSFGSAWGSLDLAGNMRLGEYRVSFRDKSRDHQIGQAQLFRLEEYKLPEFKVQIELPEEEGKQKAYRLGETVEVTIEAAYYFGGAVANAEVELLVYQNPFYHYWPRPREFPWFYEDSSQTRRRHWGGRGQVVKRETLKTDATGKAKLSFETPKDAGQDFEYRIEARVTDASRREITASDTVRVTQQRYYVYAEPEHRIYRPQDKVTINLKALDANSNPMEVEGIVKVTRDYWFEIWIDPNGREVKGEELKQLRRSMTIFPPPPPKPDEPGWRLKFRGYEHDDILTRSLKTDTNGAAELTFTPEQEGYYRLAWTSEDQPLPGRLPTPIRSETAVWVSTGTTTELGYHHGGVEIIADKDTFQAGQKAPVMLVVPTNDRYVLFSVEGEELYSYQLVHLSGTVKLVELPITEEHVPNIFLSATLVSDRQIMSDTEEIVVPPVKHFLTVDVATDQRQYEPRQEGTLTVTTRDYDGKPVAAEVALSFVDESVFYIQQEYAGDPRQFFYGEKRHQRVRLQSTFNQKGYARLVEDEQKRLVDVEQLAELREQEERRRSGKLGDELDYYARDGVRRNDLQFRGLAGRGAAALGAEPASASAPAAALLGRNLNLFDADDRMEQLAARSTEAAPPGGETPAVQVRSDFRSTVLWKPDLVTGSDGIGKATVKFPDSLTTWKATARAVTGANQFGNSSTNTRTRQPLIVRLQAPRFFVVGDLVAVSAVINNNTEGEVTVTPSITAEGLVVSGLYENGQFTKGKAGPVTVPANGEGRVDWAVSVQKPGMARIKVAGQAGQHADAMEKTFVVHDHGIDKFIARSGKVRADDITVTLNLPRERREGSTTLSVQVSPSMAVTMFDALPYLIDYPYGCTEQTMSRFLPASIVAKTLRDLGLHPEDVMSRVFGGIERQHADRTQPRGKKELQKLDEMVQAGLKRLYDFQHGDGGWGWWKEGESDHFMTAYVVWGLTLAQDAGIDIKGDSLRRGAAYLDKELVEEETNYDIQAWMLHALSANHASTKQGQIGKFQAAALDNLWKNREKLNAYTRALLALSAHQYGDADKAQVLVRNLVNGVKIDKTPDTSVVMRGEQKSSAAVLGTAHWGEDGIYYRWSDGGVEATAFALRALLRIDPKNELIEPVTNWLVKNRRGAQWSNTRDTAIVVLALTDYLRVSGELSPDLEYELLVNGQSIASRKLEGADAIGAPSLFQIDGGLIKETANEIRIVRKSGNGPIYFAAQAKFFSLEEPVTPAGNEIFVRREYFKLVGRPTLLKGYVYDRQALEDGGEVASGDRVEVVVTIEAKNNYEYLVFEDLKPAGLEAVQIRSGESLYAREVKAGAVDRKFGGKEEASLIPAAAWKFFGSPRLNLMGAVAAARDIVSVPPEIGPPGKLADSDFTGRRRWVYQELRDRKVALFIDKLPEGVWQLTYDLRAEVPGKFHALPVLGHAMYVPEIRCNSAEIRISVNDRKPAPVED